MNILFGICSWGLGHATRDLPLIRRMLKEGHKITIATTGRSLALLKKEVPECEFIHFPDYPKPYTRSAFFIAKFAAYLPFMLAAIAKERVRVLRLLRKKKFDRIIADTRYGFYHKKIPSYFIFHQLRYIAPRRLKVAEIMTESFNYSFRNCFDKFIVPDYKTNDLSGDLSHNLTLFRDQVEYIGILSNLEKKKVKQDVDCFISISGPEPSRTVFEKKVLKQAKELKGNVVIALGRPELKSIKKIDNHITIYPFLNREQQGDMMNRAKVIVSRSGYTTMMEVAELGKKALYIPTPGQTEQVYLGNYHNKQRTYHSISQKRMHLKVNVETAKRYIGLKRKCQTKNSVDRFMKIVFG